MRFLYKRSHPIDAKAGEYWSELHPQNSEFKNKLNDISDNHPSIREIKTITRQNSIVLCMKSGYSLFIWKKIRTGIFSNKIRCIYFSNEGLIADVDLIRSAIEFARTRWHHGTLEASLNYYPEMTRSFEITGWISKSSAEPRTLSYKL
jgi:hypothetical protein